jgi:hypothetical protein
MEIFVGTFNVLHCFTCHYDCKFNFYDITILHKALFYKLRDGSFAVARVPRYRWLKSRFISLVELINEIHSDFNYIYIYS